MVPRFGNPPEAGRSYRVRPGVYAILPLGTDVLLTFQSEPQPEIQLPGGGIDLGEQPLRALHREVYEETGWTIAYPRRLGAYRRYVFMPEYDLWAEKICTLYVARPVAKLGPPIEPHHQAIWAPMSEVAAMIKNDGERHFLRRLAIR